MTKACRPEVSGHEAERATGNFFANKPGQGVRGGRKCVGGIVPRGSGVDRINRVIWRPVTIADKHPWPVTARFRTLVPRVATPVPCSVQVPETPVDDTYVCILESVPPVTRTNNGSAGDHTRPLRGVGVGHEGGGPGGPR